MLRSLHIENYVLIDSLDVEFPEGLSIITGQTGAGKSILLGALSLLMGGKADASLISSGAQNCVVEGEFEVSPQLRPLLEENDVEWCDGILTIRRLLSHSGRTRAFVNDSPVSTQLLQELSLHLVDIHGQHQSLRLRDKHFQMEVLDSFAGALDLVAQCREKWLRMQELQKEIAEIRRQLERLKSDKEYNAAQFRQLDDARLREGELEELEAEQKQLANAEAIKESFAGLRSLFEPDEGLTVDVALKEAEKLLLKLSDLVPGTAGLASRLHSSRIEIADIAQSAADADAGISLSQERLEQVEDRMGLLYSLLQKHGCSTVGELISVRDSFSDALFSTDALDEKLASAQASLEKLRAGHLDICTRLHKKRSDAAPGLAKGIQDSLHFLELDRAVFEVVLSDAEPTGGGADAVSFNFSANGTNPVDVAKCASGGEISRIMLSLKAIMAKFNGMPTMIFDEIDTGVSGSAADRMGQMICRMGDDMQLIAITHLPQVAAKGSAHFVVEKSSGGGQSSVRRLSGEQRVMEIARLLSGESISPEAVANARRLIGA